MKYKLYLTMANESTKKEYKRKQILVNSMADESGKKKEENKFSN